MRRTAVFLGVSFALALSFAACGGQEGSGGKSGAARSGGGSVAASESAESKARSEALAKEAAEAEAEAERAASEAAAAAASDGSAPLTEEEKAAEAQKAEAKRVEALAVPSPVLSGPAQGVYASGVTISASVSLNEARLVYTLDGSTPGPKNGKPYSGPVAIASSAVLTVAAFVPGGNVSRPVSREITIGEVCAAAGASGDGRRGAPLGDIGAAIDLARSLGIPIVKLAVGSPFAASLEITAPISLSGGWKADFSERTDSPSVVVGLEFESTSKKAPGYALRVSGAKADANVRLERVEWRGGAGSYTAGIVVADGAAPSLADCRAFGGDGSYGYGAVVMGGAAPVFRSCTLSGGDGATSYGLSVDSARATVGSSFLLAGKGSVGGYGLSATDARIRVASSVVAGSSANVSYGAAFYNCKDSRLESCTVVGGSGKEAAGVFISAGDPAIENCIISAGGSVKSYGILDNYGDSAPSRLTGTVFLGCSGGLYYDADTKIAYTALSASGGLVSADGKAPAKPKASGCAVAAFSLSADAAYRTPAEHGMPDGKRLEGDSANDVTGKPRTEPWTIGAYEL